jgi:hypothetical protein
MDDDDTYYWRIFEHDMDVFVSLLDEQHVAQREGRPRRGFQEVEAEVDERRRSDRQLEREWNQQEDNAG